MPSVRVPVLSVQAHPCCRSSHRVQPAHDHAAFGHLLCAVRKGDADNGGQEFGRQANCQRERKEQRVDGRLGEEDVDGQDQHHHHQHDWVSR